MLKGKAAQAVRNVAELCLPIGIIRLDGEFVKNPFCHSVQQGRTVFRIPVQAHGIPVQRLAQAPHGEGVNAAGIH